MDRDLRTTFESFRNGWAAARGRPVPLEYPLPEAIEQRIIAATYRRIAALLGDLSIGTLYDPAWFRPLRPHLAWEPEEQRKAAELLDVAVEHLESALWHRLVDVLCQEMARALVVYDDVPMD